MFKYLFLTLTFCAQLYSASISIALDDTNSTKEPAGDLIYKSKSIDSSEAIKLKESGLDISTFDPNTSNLFLNTKLEIEAPAQFKNANVFTYQSAKASPTEIFRFFATTKSNKKVLMTASLDNHTNVMRSLLLRRLGFDVNRPLLKKKITLNFISKEQKELFLNRLSEQTLTSRSRWIEKEKNTQLVLRHILLDESELKNVNLYLPVMTRSRQQERRVFRSLIALYSITDLPESVNKISWKIGKIFNNTLILNHPYADKFKDTTEDDLKWLTRKLNGLNRQEIEAIVKACSYPIEVEQLVVEKIISRISSLGEKLRVKTTVSPNLNLTNKYVIDGKLIEKDFSQSAINYSNKDVPSPYRFKELFRLFGTQAVFNGLSSLLDQGSEKFVPGLYNSDAIENIQEQINEYRQENPSSDGVLPLKLFTSPTIFGRVFANRNIIFGQVLDTNSAIQLVDSVGAEMNLGLQSRLTGLSNTIIPNLGINGSIIRTYTHVRAMPDLKTASSQKINKILVPLLMKKLGRIIKNEYICSISKKPYVEVKEISEETFHYVKYDKSVSSKEDALLVRQGLIDDGVEANKILLITIDREKLCITDVANIKNESIQDFLKSFAENEIFIISDSLRLSGLANVPIPVMASMNLTLGIDNSKSLIRSIQLKKIDESIQVTITAQNDRSTRVSESLSFYIQLVRNSNLHLTGKHKSKIYDISLAEQNEAKLTQGLRVLRELFVKNDKTELYNNYKANEVEHDVKVKLNTLRMLWYKRDRFKMGHDLTVIIPNQSDQKYTLKQRTRKFYQQLDYKRAGSDFHSFTNDILGYFSNLVSLGQASNDPGKTFLGNSKKLFISTEAEVTKGYKSNPTTRVEFIRSGWSKRHQRIDKYFNEIDEMYTQFKSYNPIDRTILKGSSRLKSFDIRSTLILYPEAIYKIQSKLLSINKKSQVRFLNYLSNDGHKESLTRKGRLLIEKLMAVSKSYMDIKTKVKEINKTYKWLFTKFDIAKVLSLIGQENFFATTRVMGFLEDHHKGFLEYSTDSVGSYNAEIGTGSIDQLSSFLGLSSFQLRALNYSPGM